MRTSRPRHSKPSDNPDSPRQRKALSQVFLKVDWPVTRMVDLLVERGIGNVLEIGPGGGVLTRELLTKGLDVVAIERDERFASLLPTVLGLASHGASQERLGSAPSLGALQVITGDAIREDWSDLLAKGSSRNQRAIVGNIPYHLSTPLLMKGLAQLSQVQLILFMTQKEFAIRLAAAHGSKDYGSLSVFAQLRADIQLVFEVPRTAFKPVPKVDSAVVLLTARTKSPLSDRQLDLTEIISRQVFSQRRKKLSNSLRGLIEQAAPVAAAPVDLAQRPEDLSPDDFVTLAAWLDDKVAKRD